MTVKQEGLGEEERLIKENEELRKEIESIRTELIVAEIGNGGNNHYDVCYFSLLLHF